MQVRQVRYTEWARRDGREAEGGGLLNRYRAKSSIEGSNPSLSARQSPSPIRSAQIIQMSRLMRRICWYSQLLRISV